MLHIAQRPVTVSSDQTLYLEKGQGLLRASYLAQEAGVVSQTWHFQLIAQVLGASKKLQAGEYDLTQPISLQAFIAKMTSGDVMVRTLTIPEGLSSQQVMGVLRSTRFLTADDMPIPAEGSLAPNSYHYHRGEKYSVMIERMQAAQKKLVLEAWGKRPEAFIIQSAEDLITLASVIEKETALAAERPIIAAVFLNRLKKGMRLQSDPTVIYGLTGGLPLDRPLSKADLRQKTPYNTYRINGLPYGPIANPGADSLMAVVQPAAVDYYYFVADGTGGHIFAKTYKEHQINVAKWRKIRDGDR